MDLCNQTEISISDCEVVVDCGVRDMADRIVERLSLDHNFLGDSLLQLHTFTTLEMTRQLVLLPTTPKTVFVIDWDDSNLPNESQVGFSILLELQSSHIRMDMAAVFVKDTSTFFTTTDDTLFARCRIYRNAMFADSGTQGLWEYKMALFCSNRHLPAIKRCFYENGLPNFQYKYDIDNCTYMIIVSDRESALVVIALLARSSIFFDDALAKLFKLAQRLPKIDTKR
jgi:hypothetical protein